MKLNRTGSNWNELERSKINENWDIIEGLGDSIGKVVTGLVWKTPVDTVEDLPTNAEVGETRMVREADPDGISYVYRYDGEKWEKIQEIDVTLVNEVDRRLSAQLADEVHQLETSIANIDVNKASKTELQNGLNSKVGKNENESISWGMLNQEAKENISGEKVAVVGTNSVNTTNIVDGAATFDKRTRLGDIGQIMLSNSYNDGQYPYYETETRTLTFPHPFFVVVGKDRYRIEATTINCSVGSTGFVIFFNTETNIISVFRQTDIYPTENMVLLASANQQSDGLGGRVLFFNISCPLLIDGVDSNIYFIDKIPSSKVTIPDIASLPLITVGQSAQLPDYKRKDKTLNFESMNIFYRDKRYFINEPVTLDFSDIDSAGILVYFDTENQTFIYKSHTNLSGVPHTAILIAVRYVYNQGDSSNILINTEYTIDGKSRYFQETSEVSDKKYLFSIEKLTGDFPEVDLPGVGEVGNPFDRENDNHELVYGLFDDLMGDNPGYITREEIGRSTNDLPIYCYHFSPERAEITSGQTLKPYPKILMDSSIHGGEKLGTDTLYFLFKSICEDWQTDKGLEYLRHYVNFSVVPLPNPEDYNDDRYVGIDDINLNRDFGTPNWVKREGAGDDPFSRVESRVMRDFLFDNDDALLFIDVHVRGGSQTVSDDKTMWLGSSDSKETPILSNTIEKLSRKWRIKYQMPSGRLGHITVRDAEGTIRTYAHHVVGIPSILWEGFKASTTLSDFEGKDVVEANVQFLGETVFNAIKNYQ